MKSFLATFTILYPLYYSEDKAKLIELVKRVEDLEYKLHKANEERHELANELKIAKEWE